MPNPRVPQDPRFKRYRDSHRELLARNARNTYHAKTEEQRKAERASRKEYYRQWVEINQEKVREYNQQYRANGDKDQQKQASHKAYLANRSQRIEAARKWAAANPLRREDIVKLWLKEHPARRAAISAKYSNKRRAAIQGSGGTFQPSDIDRLMEVQDGKCAGCEKDIRKRATIDHVMPIKLGGANTADNLQLLCKNCNSQKAAMHPDRWAARLGKLFV